MPRYVYRCTECEELSTLVHMSDETAVECPKCQAASGLVKVLTSFRTPSSRPPTNKAAKVGEATESAIAEARQDLKNQKQELTKKR
jgi:putative FmdB family regulatory protein